MKKGLMTLGLGAGLMYLFDPDKGPRRRSLARDRLVRIGNDAQDLWTGLIRNLENRWQGIQNELESFITPEEVTDDQLVARVRSRLGRLVSHPRAIEVTAHDRIVTLSGPVLDHEFGKVVAGVTRVRGVRQVHNLMDAHSNADIPELQGATGTLPTERSPARRVLMGAAGGMLAMYGLKRGGLFGAAAAILGVSLLTRGITNKTVGEFMSIKSADGHAGRPAPRPRRAEETNPTYSPSGGI